MSNETPEQHADDHSEEHDHASVKTYTFIAFVLFVITAIEVAIPEIAKPMLDDPDYNRGLWVFSLYFLSIIKFFLVVAFFMHLKYDTVWYTHAFGWAMVIAVGTFIALLYLSPSEPPAQLEARLRAEGKLDVAAAAPAAAEEEELLEPDPERGKAVFAKGGCTACHVVSAIPGAVGATGPKLDGLGERAGSMVDGQDADTYIRQSIEDPYAFVVEGYMKVMPNMRAAMTTQEFEDLVALLKGL